MEAVSDIDKFCVSDKADLKTILLRNINKIIAQMSYIILFFDNINLDD